MGARIGSTGRSFRQLGRAEKAVGELIFLEVRPAGVRSIRRQLGNFATRQRRSWWCKISRQVGFAIETSRRFSGNVIAPSASDIPVDKVSVQRSRVP